MLASTYAKADLREVADKQTHLKPEERYLLLKILRRKIKLFQGCCGKWTGKPIHLKLVKNAKPYFGRPFNIPKAYHTLVKDEINRMMDEGILSPTKNTSKRGCSHVCSTKEGWKN